MEYKKRDELFGFDIFDGMLSGLRESFDGEFQGLSGISWRANGRNISVRRANGRITVELSGDVDDELLDAIKSKYPDADIIFDGMIRVPKALVEGID